VRAEPQVSNWPGVTRHLLGILVRDLKVEMTDSVDAETRSRIMRRIRSQDTGPERIVRSFLHRSGLRFRLHRPDLPGRPDIVIAAAQAVVFVHGCFWHQHAGCSSSGVPLSNRSYWRPKLLRNVRRDATNRATLVRMGWAVEVVWECALTSERRLRRLVKWLEARKLSLRRGSPLKERGSR
jgi:DNA mismatch endonuclease (patch repair protein)